MNLEQLLAGAARPKTPSRQFGQMFRQWLSKLGYPVLPYKEFLDYKKPAILKGADAALKEFAHKEIGYEGEKGLDLVLKVKNRFILGEAKFISASGGTQDKSFRETISFIKDRNQKFLRIAVIDGVVWLAPSNRGAGNRKKLSLYDTITTLDKNQIMLSTLLLKKFILSLE
jgi:hypothetical protein